MQKFWPAIFLIVSGSVAHGQEKPVPKKDADDAKARERSWTLKFKYENGNEFLAQLGALGAEVSYQTAEDSKTMILVADLKAPDKRAAVTDEDRKRLAASTQFTEDRPPGSFYVGLSDALKVKAVEVRVFFPAAVVEELANAERKYSNRLPRDIQRTRFAIDFKDGKHTIRVVEQVPSYDR